MKTLIIGSNSKVNHDVTFYLKLRYSESTVIISGDGASSIGLIETELPGLVVVDSTLIDESMPGLISKIRQLPDSALVVISHEDNDWRNAKLFEAGVDDIVKYPFNPILFLSKINVLLRRIQARGCNRQQVVRVSNEMSINFGGREVLRSGKHVHLTPIEYNLLSEFVMNNGKVLTYETLLNKIWGSECEDPSYLKKYIYNLRSKIEPDWHKPQILLNERGIGYKLLITYQPDITQNKLV